MALLTTGLVSYYKLDEASGDAADSLGVNTLTNNGTTAYAAAKINNGIDFELSSSQSLSIADGSQTGLDLATDFSISVWIKLESFPVAGLFTIVSKRTGGNGYSIYYSDDIGAGVDGFVFDIQGSEVYHAVTLSTGTWYHYVFVYTKSAGTMDVYQNGAFQATVSSLSTALAGSTSGFYVGSEQGGAIRFFDGLMDELGIWSRTISATEASFLYNAGDARAYADLGKNEVPQTVTETVTVSDPSPDFGMSIIDTVSLTDSSTKRPAIKNQTKSSTGTWRTQNKT